MSTRRVSHELEKIIIKDILYIVAEFAKKIYICMYV